MAGDRGVSTDIEAPAIADVVGRRAGDVVAGRYALRERLGKGGGGSVWRAFDQDVGEEIALKIVATSGDAERWRREVALARKISHPNVCRVYDLFEDDGVRYVTMELVTGETLRALIGEARVGREAREWVMQQVVLGVAAIHRAGVIHRDLKPENIIVDSTHSPRRVVIVDFGLARLPSGPADAPAVTGHGMIVGTPGYMAPEQALALSVDCRTDVYALGLVLHELATGSRPGASGPTTPERPAARARSASRVTEPAALWPPWSEAVARCLEVDPDLRYRSAIELAAATVSGSHRPRRGWRVPILLALTGAAIAGITALIVATATDDSTQSADAGATSVPPPNERRLAFTGVNRPPLAVAISADASRVALIADQQVIVRPLDGGPETTIDLPTTARGSAVARHATIVGLFDNGDALVRVRSREVDWQLWRVGTARSVKLFSHARWFGVALSHDESRVALAVDGTDLVSLVLDGLVRRRALALDDGSVLGAVAWSPDGERIAFVHLPRERDGDRVEVVGLKDGARRVVHVAADDALAHSLVFWPRRNRLLLAINGRRAARLVGVDPEAARSRVAEITHWPGVSVHAGAARGSTLVLVRGAEQSQVHVGKLNPKYGSVSLLRAAHPVGTDSRRLAGWTAAERLVYASETGASFDVVSASLEGDGVVIAEGSEDLWPRTVVGTAALVIRPGTPKAELVAAALDEPTRLVASLTDLAGADVVRCAGDRTEPCVVEAAGADGRAVYRQLELAGGRLGPIVFRGSPIARQRRSFAISSDGKRLAYVDGTSAMVRVELGGGPGQRVTVEGARLHSVSWARDGNSVIVAARDFRDHAHALIRIRSDGSVRKLASSDVRRYGRAHESPDGKRVAVQIVEAAFELWLLEGL